MTVKPTPIPGSSGRPQVFAAAGLGRARATRTALVVGALLLASWLAALALGMFGGFGTLPGLGLGGARADEAPAAARVPAAGASSILEQAVARAVGKPGSTSNVLLQSATAGPAQSANGQSAIAPHGKPTGSGAGTGSGKPIGTPGTGGTNGGGNGNGKALGLAK